MPWQKCVGCGGTTQGQTDVGSHAVTLLAAEGLHLVTTIPSCHAAGFQAVLQGLSLNGWLAIKGILAIWSFM